MDRNSKVVAGIAAALIAVMGTFVMTAQDKYTVKVPGGLAFSEFRGYEACFAPWIRTRISSMRANIS